ncbi:serine/threonine-protein kinase D6PKL1-like [Forsythia ovata]|uniref:Serine/threonine-protein kinase D6PKL1-like n=1 Tax=Forsythia ovata TaxID=205694 RepID=A0ABD1Q994_9LAMI
MAGKQTQKLVNCKQLEESGKLTGLVPLDAFESKRSLTNSTESTNSPFGDSDSNISSTDNEQVSTAIDHEVYGIRSSLETSVYLEKKTAEQGSVKNSSVSAKNSDRGFSPAKMSRSAN